MTDEQAIAEYDRVTAEEARSAGVTVGGVAAADKEHEVQIDRLNSDLQRVGMPTMAEQTSRLEQAGSIQDAAALVSYASALVTHAATSADEDDDTLVGGLAEGVRYFGIDYLVPTAQRIAETEYDDPETVAWRMTELIEQAASVAQAGLAGEQAALQVKADHRMTGEYIEAVTDVFRDFGVKPENVPTAMTRFVDVLQGAGRLDAFLALTPEKQAGELRTTLEADRLIARAQQKATDADGIIARTQARSISDGISYGAMPSLGEVRPKTAPDIDAEISAYEQALDRPVLRPSEVAARLAGQVRADGNRDTAIAAAIRIQQERERKARAKSGLA